MDSLAVCTPGLEEVLGAELAALGIKRARRVRGGVTFSGSTRDLYAANLWLRTASRVLVRVAQFRAETWAELERHASEIDWQQWMRRDTRPVFRVTSSGSRLYHTGAIEERLTRVVGGAHERDATATQLFVVRVQRDDVTVSVDSSGENLHRRGWRLETAKAPLRETLAAAMVLASGWDAHVPLVDPMCGSGTIAIEAALLARGRAPGAGRPFAFQRWPSFAPGTWASVREQARLSEVAAANRTPPFVIAADRDAGAARITRANATRAGVADLVDVRRSPLSETLAARPSEQGWIITNPPYGARVSAGHDLRDLYATLGRAAPWDVGVLTADRSLTRHLHLPLAEQFRTTNGGIPVTFLTTGSGQSESITPGGPVRTNHS
jgi:putative N6-adenine-specific DNA methylase